MLQTEIGSLTRAPTLRQLRWLFSFGLILAAGLPASQAAPKDDSVQFNEADVLFFEKRVRPILAQRCFECHASTSSKLRGGLQLDGREGVLQGGDTGPAAEPGQPDKSLLIEAIRYDSQQLQMPPDGKMPDAEIAILTEWVRRNLPFPVIAKTSHQRRKLDIDAGRDHWAFRPWKGGSPPVLSQEWVHWPKSRMDSYILAAQLEHRLQPAPEASRAILIRRVKLDLLGLPPTVEEIEQFNSDSAPDAYERLVDRYLASPQYGERWGRHWLDLARYCDVPESWREGIGQAWVYRDWVVQALNEDLPYDDFIRYQFAADLLPGAKPEDNAALGFLGISPTYWKELKLDHMMIKQVVAEEWEERIETIGGTFLGLTLACARCHDHKFDPITTQDYYALAGVLASVKLDDCSLLPPERATSVREARSRIKELKKQIESLNGKKPVSDENRTKVADLEKQVEQLRRETPDLDHPEAFGVVEASLHVLPDGPSRTKLEYRSNQPQDVAIQIRGSASNPGAVVARGFPAVLSANGRKPFSDRSGRLELSEAIISDAMPLTARVFVNRVWKHHFGRGLVGTPSNFGVQGDLPTHPELLDDLADRFVRNGWSLKWLHREIVCSATYRQRSTAGGARDADPDNIWLARMPIRRLDVEVWRDSILAATGELDSRVGGPSIDVNKLENRRRTLYGTVERRNLADVLRLYDFPDPIAHVASREPTTTPLQQLFVLNSPFMLARCRELLNRLKSTEATAPEQKIRCLFAFVFARDVSKEEEAALMEYLESLRNDKIGDEEAWLQVAQVLLGTNELMFVE